MQKAVFVLAKTCDGKFAATTRAADRGEEGRIGLPGGKVDDGESLVDAVMREAYEEGWGVCGLDPMPFHSAIVDGYDVYWFAAAGAIRLTRYKEQDRIKPVPVSLKKIAKCGYGNDTAVSKYLQMIGNM